MGRQRFSRTSGSAGRWAVAALGVLALVGGATGGGAGEPWTVVTRLLRAESLGDGARVRYTWQGDVVNRGAEPARIAVRLIGRDAAGKPIVHLEVPGIDVGPTGRVTEEAVFEVDEAIWRRIYTVDGVAEGTPDEGARP